MLYLNKHKGVSYSALMEFSDIFWSTEWWGLVQGSISTGSPVGQSAMGWPRWLRRIAGSIFSYGLNSESLKSVFRFTPGHFYVVCHVLRLIVIDLYLCKHQWLCIQTSNSTVPIAKNFIFTSTFKPWTCQKNTNFPEWVQRSVSLDSLFVTRKLPSNFDHRKKMYHICK